LLWSAYGKDRRLRSAELWDNLLKELGQISRHKNINKLWQSRNGSAFFVQHFNWLSLAHHR
jgi:hypothetical protein